MGYLKHDFYIRPKPRQDCKACDGDGSVLVRKQIWVEVDENCPCCKGCICNTLNPNWKTLTRHEIHCPIEKAAWRKRKRRGK